MSDLIIGAETKKETNGEIEFVKDFNLQKEEERKLLEQDYKNQLKEFYEDQSYYSDYDCFSPFTKKVLVKVFKFTPTFKADVGSTTLMVESPYDGSLKPKIVALNEKLFPIVKVIKVGTGVENTKDIKVDTLYTVPSDEIIGDDWNPEFMFVMNTMVQQGQKGGLARIPEGMRQRIPRLEKNWDKYKFGLPNKLGSETEEERLIYLI